MVHRYESRKEGDVRSGTQALGAPRTTLGAMRSSSKIDSSKSANQLSGAPVGDPGAGGNTVDRSWNRWLLFGLLGIMLIVAAVFVATTLRLFVFPSTDQPTHVDGILDFNG